MKLIKRHIPYWCKYHEDLNKDNNSCCNCGENLVKYQVGDGKVLHSLCYLCYNCFYGRLRLDKEIKKDTHFCRGEEVFEPICEECKQLKKEKGG